ncbi:MAG: acyl-CoA dehydrogenase family protein [Bacillota bacterium]
MLDFVRQFARKELLPRAGDWEREVIFPREVFRKLAQAGLMTMLVGQEYGGLGLNRSQVVELLEELATGCYAVAAYTAVNNMVASLLQQFGSESQKNYYLPALCRGEIFGAFALTEPGAGSDAQSLRTKAVKTGDGYRLEGQKVFISGGGEAGLYLVFARTEAGITAFIVEAGMPGFRLGRKERKLGVEAIPTRELFFEGVLVPQAQVLGQLGAGFAYAVQDLAGGRLNIAAISVGLARAALEQVLPLVSEPSQRLADLYIGVEAARALVRQAAAAVDAGADATLEAAAAKTFATDTAVTVTSAAVELAGITGVRADLALERFFRQAKLASLWRGLTRFNDC